MKSGTCPQRGCRSAPSSSWSRANSRTSTAFPLDSCDPAWAITFYREVFGWEATQLPDEPLYWRWDAGGVQFGGLTTLGAMVQSVGTASHWLVYFRVSDVDATVVAGPVEVSGARYAALTDPYGAMFAVSRP